MIKKGRLRADKIEYPDGVGCTVWYPFDDEYGAELEQIIDSDLFVAEESGICFNFSYDDIDDFIELLQALKKAEAEVFVEDHSDETKH